LAGVSDAGESAPPGVEDDLRRAALSFAQSERVDLDSEAQAVLDEAISKASERIVSEGKSGDDEAIRNAETQLQKLLSLAALRPSFADTDEPATVNRQQLSGALSRLCPGFWPFC
jgi:hypothetical protein